MGQKSYEGSYKDGNQDGLVMTWHENGQKFREGNYKDDQLDGLFVQWNENGIKRVEGNFKKGELISGEYWNSDGQLVDSPKEAGLE